MIQSILILIVATIVAHLLIHYLLYDLIGGPFNVLYERVTYDTDTVNHRVYKRTWLFYAICLVLTIICWYLLSALVAAYLSWTTAKHPNSAIMTIIAMVLPTSILSRFSTKRRQMLQIDPSYNYLPSVYIAPILFWLGLGMSLVFVRCPEFASEYWAWALLGGTE